MFRRRDEAASPPESTTPTERITSVLGSGTVWKGSLTGSGGVRIEGAFEGEIALRGVLVVGETGRVTCQDLRANTVIVAGTLRGDIITQKLEIRSTGRVWGNVTTAAFATEEGAFLRGQVQMEDQVDIGLPSPQEAPAPLVATPAEQEPGPENPVPST
jgi:cytoskeletal protein CcmA (bactofilin family)